jgi:hypothetical protein
MYREMGMRFYLKKAETEIEFGIIRPLGVGRARLIRCQRTPRKYESLKVVRIVGSTVNPDDIGDGWRGRCACPGAPARRTDRS